MTFYKVRNISITCIGTLNGQKIPKETNTDKQRNQIPWFRTKYTAIVNQKARC